jgi:hypothetical protein
VVSAAAAATVSARSSPAPRKASAAARASAKFWRWKPPGARNGTPASVGARTSVAWRSAATRSATSAEAGSSGPTTSVPWSRTTASFSAAISATVGPSQRVCSRPTEVSACTFDGITLVASKRPPRPASITATSTPRRASSW